MAATDVLTEVLRLPAEQRAKLARELIRSLDSERDADDTDTDDAQNEELERRAADAQAGTAETLTFDDYRAHVRARRAARARP
ncbi:MAG: addiction module protein [Myxococcales bacterium]|nr:addiction module protein [Myxococcales bacterium]